MSVSSELLCSFELLKPLDSSALKSHIKKGRNKRQQMLNSPVSVPAACATTYTLTMCSLRVFSHRVSNDTTWKEMPSLCLLSSLPLSFLSVS